MFHQKKLNATTDMMLMTLIGGMLLNYLVRDCNNDIIIGMPSILMERATYQINLP
jgi:hypothetical protein